MTTVTQQKPTERNHYVPQFLQKYFVGEDGKLWIYDKDGGDPRSQTPRDTGVERFLYTVRKDDGNHDDSLEKAFAELEGATKPILDRIIKPGARIEEGEKPILAEFMAYLQTRVPRYIEAANEIGSAVGLECLSELASDEARFNKLYARMREDPKNADMPPVDAMRKSFELFESGKLGVAVRRQVALGVSLSVSGELYETLMGLHWTICDAPSGVVFLTGDSPVTSIALHDDGRAQFGGNWVHPNFEVSFPISPSACLYLTKRPRQARFRCGEDLVSELNRRTAHIAERWVYSRFRSKATAKLVRDEAAATYGRPKIDTQEARRLIRAIKKHP